MVLYRVVATNVVMTFVGNMTVTRSTIVRLSTRFPVNYLEFWPDSFWRRSGLVS